MTAQERKAFIAWHEERMSECGYPDPMKERLRGDRTKWLSGVKVSGEEGNIIVERCE